MHAEVWFKAYEYVLEVGIEVVVKLLAECERGRCERGQEWTVKRRQNRVR